MAVDIGLMEARTIWDMFRRTWWNVYACFSGGLLGSRHPRDWPAVCGSRCSPGARKWGQDTENMELQGG